MKHDLDTFKKRFKAPEIREEKEAIREIETERPGHFGTQEFFYIGQLKGMGRIYHQTLIDTYNKVAMGKVYDRKSFLTAADLFNERMIPFFVEHEIPLLRILTDRAYGVL